MMADIIKRDPSYVAINWIVATRDQLEIADIPRGSHLDLTQSEFKFSTLKYYSQLKGLISAIRVESSQWSLTEMVDFLRQFEALSYLEVVVVDTHRSDETRHHSYTMIEPTWQKVLEHDDTMGLRLDCDIGIGTFADDGRLKMTSICTEECYAPAILRDVDPNVLTSLYLSVTESYSPDFVRLTVLDRLAAGLFPNLTRLTISVCGKHADQITIPETVRGLKIYIENFEGDGTRKLSAPYVTDLDVERRKCRSKAPVRCDGFSADGFGSLKELTIVDVHLRVNLPFPPKLTRIEICGIYVAEASIEAIGGFSGLNRTLQSIRIEGTKITMTQILQLSRFAPLARIKVRSCKFIDLPMVDFKFDVPSGAENSMEEVD
jgi:hypothetical protein